VVSRHNADIADTLTLPWQPFLGLHWLYMASDGR